MLRTRGLQVHTVSEPCYSGIVCLGIWFEDHAICMSLYCTPCVRTCGNCVVQCANHCTLVVFSGCLAIARAVLQAWLISCKLALCLGLASAISRTCSCHVDAQ